MTPQQIKDLRISLNQNQKQFADFLDVSQVTVSHWELGKRNPNRWVLEKLYNLKANAPYLSTNKTKKQ